MSPKTKSPLVTSSQTTARILIIEDEPDAGEILSKILTEQGFTVEVATSGEEGLKQIQKDSIDLVLLDMVLPKMDGIEVLRQIKSLRPKTIVIMMTGYETVKSAVEAMRTGAYDYLTKPLAVDRMAQSIQQALQVRSIEQAFPKPPTNLGPVTPDQMVGEDLSIVAVFDLVRRIAPQEITVLIRGESGTGKELIARAIHTLSHRREKPFVPVDCASLPESLFESELFGYERGAFTGAEMTKQGRFEQANRGTLFLDEIGNLGLTAQAKLLRVLQDKQINRLGSENPIQTDVRILSATNQNLEDLVQRALFREDLFHRLNVFVIHLPPLRQRGNDVKLLAQFFLERFNQEFGKEVKAISEEAMRLLSCYSWHGNIRELENTLKTAILLADQEIFLEHLPEKVRSAKASDEYPSPTGNLREVSRRAAQETEKHLILRVLRQTRGNKRQAAKRLGIDYKTLFNKLKTMGVTKDQVEELKNG